MSDDGELAIDVRGLTKRYGPRTVVDHVDLRLGRGRICGFLGPNGSGKTTTIRMLCGLLTPDEGEGTCLGLDMRKRAGEIKRQVGYMTQRFGLYEDLSIRQNLDFVARLFELDERPRRVDEALDRLGLKTRKDQLAGSLSGGWKQRLALAACLLHEPRLLLLDEPTAGVDPKARRAFWDEIHALAADGITVLVSTHYMDEAERCHRLAYLAYGDLLARGTVDITTKRKRGRPKKASSLVAEEPKPAGEKRGRGRPKGVKNRDKEIIAAEKIEKAARRSKRAAAKKESFLSGVASSSYQQLQRYHLRLL